MNIDKNNLDSQNKITLGAGALTGASGAYFLTRARNNSLAKSALKALNGNSAECDAFIAKHENLMKKSVASKKGFFGKLNNILRESKGNGIACEDVKQGTETLLRQYKEKAIEKLTKKGKTSLDAEVSALEEKYIAKDISKTFRSASKLKSALIISSAALFSAIAFSAIREMTLDISAKKQLKKQENEIKNEAENNKQEDDIKVDIEPKEKFEFYPEGKKKPSVKSVH